MNLLDETTKFMLLGGHNTSGGDWSDPEKRNFRQELMIEEFSEYMDKGEYSDDLVEAVDGLLDIIVIAWGTILAYVGEEKAVQCAGEVFTSNLSKVDGSLGPTQIRDDGKIMKPPGWQPPNIEGVLNVL